MPQQKPKITLITIPQALYRDRASIDDLIPNVAIVSLVNQAEKGGYGVDFYDVDLLLPSEKEMFNYFKEKKPDIVGMSAIVSTSYNQAKTLARRIKKASPSTLIVLGGHMAATANIILRRTAIDICVLGDGEKPFVDLIKYVDENGTSINSEKIRKIRGVTFINDEGEMEFTGYGERIPSSELPFPDYKILSRGFPKGYNVLKHYLTKAKDSDIFKYDPRTYEPGRKPMCAKMWVTKGCIGRCTFCQRFTLGFQIYDINKVEEYVKDLKENYDVQFILLMGENFIANKKFCYEVAELMKKHNILWAVQGVRCNMVGMDDLKFFKERGCTNLKYGIEAGSDKILKIMDKRFTVEEVFSSLKESTSIDIPSSPLCFCIAMPGETDKTIKETARFLANVSLMMGVPPSNLYTAINYALPLPGSPLYEYAQLQGIIGKSIDEEEQFLIDISDMHAGKEKFINVAGKSVKEMLFWEYLVYYEAMKLYYSKKKKASKLDKKKQTGQKSRKKKKDIRKEGDSNSFFRRLTRYDFKKLLNLLIKKPISVINTVMYHSKWATYIPRPILYPIMRNLVYLEYLLQNISAFIRGLFGDKNHFIFRYQYVKPKYKVDFKDGTSLREINDRLRKHYPPPKTLTEKNQQILYLGR